MMKIGVSGASGQLGNAVVQALAETVAAENLVAISRTPKTDRTYSGRLGRLQPIRDIGGGLSGLGSPAVDSRG
jgi:NAD(P)H dehydrogenase (quinone)